MIEIKYDIIAICSALRLTGPPVILKPVTLLSLLNKSSIPAYSVLLGLAQKNLERPRKIKGAVVVVSKKQ